MSPVSVSRRTKKEPKVGLYLELLPKQKDIIGPPKVPINKI